MDFSERLLRRHELWWEGGVRLAQVGSYRPALDGRRELRRRRSRNDPEATWRCCARWPRSLLNKWNGREFAARHGAPLPDLYCYCRSARQIPRDSLPNRYVVRSLFGSNAEGVRVMVDGRDLLRAEASPSDIGRGGPRRSAGGRGPYLVEQFVGAGNERTPFPVEFKCHTFAGRVVAVQVGERTPCDPLMTRVRYYRPDWTDFDDRMDLREPLTASVPRPDFLREMLDLSSRIGAAIGTYMRIDFLAGEAGWVFNEFSSTPMIRHLCYTPTCNTLLGKFWDELCPDAA